MRLFLVILLAFASLGNANAQAFRARFELGVMGGEGYYIGDLNPTKHFVYSKPAFGAIFRYNLSTRASLRLTGTYGNVWADDAKASDQVQVNRNLNFRSKILEVAFGVEIDLFKYRINDMKYPISPYFFYELAYFRMNPMTSHNGSDIELRSLGTEGQGTSLSDKNPYNLNQVSMPIGIGVKFNLKKRLAMSIEYGIRKTFTDFLDDVSGNYVDSDILSAENGPLAAELANPSIDGVNRTGYNRGNSNTKDWYAFYGIMLTFKPFKYKVCDFQANF
ncbi:MAG: outer membrane beta-barrel protein [Crocinitomicaceae bacterium]|nr:outer membrane beta-barrel protein [Crocinitomicaceae bacterium]